MAKAAGPRAAVGGGAAPPTVVVVPGNGAGGDLRGCNFYGWAEAALRERGSPVRLPEGGMPDPLRAREAVWVPHIVEALGAGEGTVLVGHSSGAAAALRVAEKHRLAGLVLVAAYGSDLGDELERKSGYFDRPFEWERIRTNSAFIAQIAGRRDSLVPFAAQAEVAEALRLTRAADGVESSRYFLVECAGRDHFFEPPFDELLEAIDAGLAAVAGGAG